MEDQRAAPGAARGGPHVCSVGRDGCEEYEEAVSADVGDGIGIAEGERVGAFAEQLVREEVVTYNMSTLCSRHA